MSVAENISCRSCDDERAGAVIPAPRAGSGNNQLSERRCERLCGSDQHSQPTLRSRQCSCTQHTRTHVTYPLQENHEGWIEHLKDSFRREGNRFSHQHIQVAVQHSEVVGLVLSFGGRDEPRLNAAVGSWLEQEAADDEWYVDALAVLKNWGRKGIGTRLLQAAERQTRRHHYPKVALHVAEGNQQALALYAHQHYVVTRETVLYQRPYVRLIKTLEDGARGNEGTERPPLPHLRPQACAES